MIDEHRATEADYIWATIKIPFFKVVECAQCPFLDVDIVKRKICRRNHEYIPNQFSIGFDCPLEIIQNDID